MGDKPDKSWKERQEELKKEQQALDRSRPVQPTCHDFNKVYSEYVQKREENSEINGPLMRIASLLLDRHDPYIENPSNPLTKKVKDASEEYRKKLTEYYRQSEDKFSTDHIVILSEGLFAHRERPHMKRNLEGFIDTLMSAPQKDLEIQILDVTRGVHHETAEFGIDIPRPWEHKTGIAYSFKMPYCRRSDYEGEVALTYSLDDPHAIRIMTEKHTITSVNSQNKDKQKTQEQEGAIRIPLINIFGHSSRGFSDVTKSKEITITYQGVVLYQQPKELAPHIPQGKEMPPEITEKPSQRSPSTASSLIGPHLI